MVGPREGDPTWFILAEPSRAPWQVRPPGARLRAPLPGLAPGGGPSLPIWNEYHFVNKLKTWTEAQTYCRDHYTDLATIENQEDTDELIKTVKGDVERVWIGLEKSERKVSSERYIVITETKTWTEAQSYCREHHTDLVSVRNQTENHMIWSLIKDSSSAWIGLFMDSWKWSDQSKSSFRNWAPGQPNNKRGNEKCADMQVTGNKPGQWHDLPCDNKMPFVCYEDKLILINETLTWSEALNYCRERHVDLVSVHSEKIQKWVMEMVEKASTDHVWLGLHYSCTTGSWFWVSGQSLCYQNWAPGNGTGVEECSNGGITGAVESGGNKEWISFSDTERFNFICSNYEAKVVPKV
ncbi:C-type mannose receptor 2-like [Chanos chanos]|uniref:C-type mannose receptor 2-like n=1 Tax=Chanos chanos TaxID=29144 RepID=A0A6J2VT61_CHACN|nr:C-type mannose receptor 2-like [Chanos chanos]